MVSSAYCAQRECFAQNSIRSLPPPPQAMRSSVLVSSPLTLDPEYQLAYQANRSDCGVPEPAAPGPLALNPWLNGTTSSRVPQTVNPPSSALPTAAARLAKSSYLPCRILASSGPASASAFSCGNGNSPARRRFKRRNNCATCTRLSRMFAAAPYRKQNKHVL